MKQTGFLRKMRSNNVKSKKSNVNTGELVLCSIKKLMKNTGWTTRTIVKFIRTEYSISEATLSQKVRRALKRGVKLGLLKMTQGRYRLNHFSACSSNASKAPPLPKSLRIKDSKNIPSSKYSEYDDEPPRKRRHGSRYYK